MRGDRVKYVRKMRGWTQEQLGAAVNLKKSTISGIENNKENRSEKDVSKFAEALGCTPDYLLGFSDDPRLDSDQHKRLRKKFDELFQELQDKPEHEQEMYLRMFEAALGIDKK
ncbi:helix-turn-helix transcriptional regulator [Bacillus cereus]|uniref:helix-turn-helix domain-containing protein n=1 Tax=Bacillus TaxID=1386 RepID=UPI00240598DC|nr:helix-turn-helix transcriptional regulator [Bacillus cereus]MDF9525038.1 helix-turn-helix transcriptional regulator [Bacillus cereus]MDF9564781.1 helix-turn-helix transcriptional regulator [Bacillus cereus]HDR7203934.1 helix-turn-helix transcriptional regulator [Bacillus cereus]HDR8047197.1 helix-turn-helix transcriptional regulator [Bacillus cereus]